MRRALLAAAAVALAAVLLMRDGERRRAAPAGDRRTDVEAPAPAEARRAGAGGDAGPVAVSRAEEAEARRPTRGTAEPAVLVVVRVVRPSDGSPVTDAAVQLCFAPIVGSSDGGGGWEALDEAQRLERQDYVDCPPTGGGLFVAALPRPAVLRRARVTPRVDGFHAAPLFLETEIALGDRRLDEEGRVELTLAVDEGGRIRGVVVDAAGGFPIAGAEVAAVWWQEEWNDWYAASDGDGRFHVAGIEPGVARSGAGPVLAARAPGYVARRVEAPPPPEGSIDVDGVRIELERGVVVRGRVTPPDGDAAGARPLTAFLHARARGEEGIVQQLDFLVETPVGRDGRFELPAVPPHDEALLELDGVLPPVVRRLDLRTQPRELSIGLSPRRRAVVATRDLTTGEALPLDGWATIVRVPGGGPREWRALGVENGFAAGASLELMTFARRRDGGEGLQRGVGTLAVPDAPAGEPVALDVGIEWTPLASGQAGETRSDLSLAAAEGAGPLVALELRRDALPGEGPAQPLARTPVLLGDLAARASGVVYAGEDGVVRVALRPGRRFLRVRAAGYRAEHLEVAAEGPVEARFVLPLRR